MDEASQPLSSARPNNNYRNGSGIVGPGGYSIQAEIAMMREDNLRVHNAVLLLEAEKDSLRKAIRKLKVRKAFLRN